MKATLKVFIILGIASMVAGFTYAHWFRTETKVETIVYHETVRAGDTLDDIIEHYYNEQDGRSWQEFRYDHMERNKVHFADGRALQIGDIICIEVHRQIRK